MNMNNTTPPQQHTHSTYYTCEFCKQSYIPRKRRVQKYCSESCRVLACRARHPDRYGAKEGEHKSLPNSVVERKIEDLADAINDLKRNQREGKAEQKHDATIALEILRAGLKNIEEKISTDTWVSGVAPFAANAVSGLYSGKSASNQSLSLPQFEAEFKDLCQRTNIDIHLQNKFLQMLRGSKNPDLSRMLS